VTAENSQGLNVCSFSSNQLRNVRTRPEQDLSSAKPAIDFLLFINQEDSWCR
jgi:hypothetical protein